MIYGLYRVLGLGAVVGVRVCKIMAFWALFGGFGLFFCILLGSRQGDDLPSSGSQSQL